MRERATITYKKYWPDILIAELLECKKIWLILESSGPSTTESPVAVYVSDGIHVSGLGPSPYGFEWLMTFRFFSSCLRSSSSSCLFFSSSSFFLTSSSIRWVLSFSSSCLYTHVHGVIVTGIVKTSDICYISLKWSKKVRGCSICLNTSIQTTCTVHNQQL